ncbi:hypothetical protein COW36_18760 [bacterium (Candidatus Blackallbacteria) CG17_big_fil_post_rev_8_21_14_2_50_48_46]|uniref:Uncharacterized protein n=1 Tax=bacterium (Candidatus Blackallbacteria) CG17_big_fil_post_rev_8_21_14_2_50_48_46 TaxID=2014261 RepID=A0A2M7G059_9BACT|nr:MAG: hypothetical protein COW64_07115 [bacterium (Candidatus Blackallbacteria) CG18_big_fil_WC_8_21_14_2_50_49_26]PIW14971.1 MAG: hypothetical protein COW36_18760 [bacterium (Candidatus Blackallbacteria) CG17_big_fil_post_rev_8_21_14_2_50_48_46]PIW51194.1 MAG: hypothetical protein COW20_00025 [bacterium (Candidatus Blackallbacteria) CG13_big_fil_rev_8_21_14_2_50_49_14]
MQLSLNDFLTPAERLPELLDHRKPKNLKADRWALAKPLLQSAPIVTENPAEFERVIESVLDTLALNQKQGHERMIGHTVTWVTGATLPKPKHHKGKILAVLSPGAKREDWIHLLPPEFDEMGKLVKGMEDARQIGKERSKELKALRAEWKRLYKAVKVNAKNGGYLVAEEAEEGVVYRCIAPHLVHRQAESQTLLLQKGLAETATASLPEPEQTDNTPAPVCSKQTPEVSRLQTFAEHEWVCDFCSSKMRFRYTSDIEVGFDCSKNPKHLLKITYSGMNWSNHTGGFSGPLPDMLGNYFKGEFNERQKELILLAFDLRGEKTGNIEDEQSRKQVFLESGKVVNRHVERTLEILARIDKEEAEESQPNSTPVSSPSVTAPEPAAKVILGKPLGRSHPGLGINKPVCFYCKGQEELEYAGLFPNAIKSMNHHIWRCKKQPRHQLVCAEKGDWWYQWCGGVGYGVTYGVPELWMWRDIFKDATGQEPELTPEPEIDVQGLELEAQDLRLKLREVDRKRGLVKQASDLKAAIDAATNEINRICMHGYSASLDAMLGRKQVSIDAMRRELGALNEEIGSTIIPVTWRWEERLAEIEKTLGQAKGGQS